jgi:hypothetical protein
MAGKSCGVILVGHEQLSIVVFPLDMITGPVRWGDAFGAPAVDECFQA